MRKKHFLFAALFFAALAFGFVGCENPNGDLLNNGDNNNKPTTLEAPTLVATGGASDVEYSTVTLWGRINTDTLWAFPNIKWGIECSTSKEEMQSHKGKKVLCTTDLVGENSDEYSVAFTELTGGKMLYYNAYLVINDMKYIYGEVDSVHLDVKLTVNSNNTSYGTVTGSGTYDHLAEATITATPEENYYLTGWSDCDSKELSRTITLTSDSTITANFAKKPYLTVKTNSSDYGTVTGSGYYMPGEEVTITATPKPGFKFVKWNDSNTDNTRIITMGYVNVTYTATFEVSPNNVISGTENGYDYVDLGLPSGLKWATCNVGASTPEGYGNYYAWGETTTKSSYTTSNYTYSSNPPTTLPLYKDAAAVNMGGSWRMPTYDELNELKTKCTWTWTYDYNGTGVAGRIVTSKTNGNFIFLPAAGLRGSSDLSDAGSFGYYWSSSLSADGSYYAYELDFNSVSVYWSSSNRYYGESVRGVFSK